MHTHYVVRAHYRLLDPWISCYAAFQKGITLEIKANSAVALDTLQA